MGTKETSEEFQKRRKAQLRKGLSILLSFLLVVVIVNIAIALSKGWWALASIIISIILFILIYLLVVYFIWGPVRIGGVFPSEGYIAVITRGGTAHRPVINSKGRALTEGTDNQDLKDRWRVVNANDPRAHYKTKNFYGLYLFIPFLEGVYEHNMHWRKWDNTKEIAVDRNELLWQTSIMDYPHYIDKLKAEASQRGSVNIRTIVVMRMEGAYDALFSTASEWIDIVGPELEGAYNAFIKTKTIDDLIVDKKSLSAMLYEFLETYKPVIEYNADNDDKNYFFNRIRYKYGIIISYIEVIDIEGADKETKEAIKAKNLAILQAEAINVLAEAEQNRISIIAVAPIKSALNAFTDMTGISEKELKRIFKEDPDKYHKEYEPVLNRLIEVAIDQVYSGRNQRYVFTSNGSKGGVAGTTFEAVIAGNIATRNIPGGQGPGSSNQSPTTKKGEEQSTPQLKKEKNGKIIIDKSSPHYGLTEEEIVKKLRAEYKNRDKDSGEDKKEKKDLTDEQIEALKEKDLYEE